MTLPFETIFLASVLGLLTYCGVLAVLGTLAARIRGQKLRHDLVVESRRRRADYLASLPGAREAAEQAAAEAAQAAQQAEEPAPPQRQAA